GAAQQRGVDERGVLDERSQPRGARVDLVDVRDPAEPGQDRRGALRVGLCHRSFPSVARAGTGTGARWSVGAVSGVSAAVAVASLAAERGTSVGRASRSGTNTLYRSP